MKIPLARPLLGEEEVEAVTRVIRSGHLAQGPEVAAFEDEFAQLVDPAGGVTSVAVNNGTAALQVALQALGVGPGDEVIVPALTFIASANAVRGVGATPVFADVDGSTFTLDPDSAESRITSRTAAVMAVHLYGQPADLDAIGALCARHGLPLIEDAAQAHGARWRGRGVGGFGIGCFSFYPTKNMTTGEGGMVTTRDSALADRMRLLRNHGMRAQYEYAGSGVNLRMTDLSAAIGRVQLRRLPQWNEARRRNAAWFDAHLDGVTVPAVRDGAQHVYHQYTVLSDDRDALMAHLRAEEIGCGVYYPQPLHQVPLYATGDDLPVSESVCRRALSLPVRPDLTQDELEAVAAAVGALAVRL